MSDKDYELEEIIASAVEKKKNSQSNEEKEHLLTFSYESKTPASEYHKNREGKHSGKKTKKQKKKMNKALKVVIIILVVILVLALAVCGAFVGIAYHYIDKIDIVTPEEEVFEIVDVIPEDDDLTTEPDSPKEEIQKVDDTIKENIEKPEVKPLSDDDVYNVLLIGTDTRNNNDRGRSDSMILVSINEKTEEIYMTSFMRDSYVSIPGKYNNRINAAYAYGGPQLLMDTIEQNFKIKIDKYVRVNFFSFMEVIDAVGGVTINVTDAEVPVLNSYLNELNRLLGADANSGKLSSGGTYNLSGKQALGYCRIRYVGNADFQRTQRQRDVLMKVFEKAKGLSLEELDEFLNVLLPKLTTNIQKDEIFSLLMNSPKYFKYDVKQLRVPADGTYSNMTINRMAVLGIDFNANINMLHREIYG